MTWVAWPTLVGRIHRTPVEEGEQRPVALHAGISGQEVVHGRLVKLSRKGYDRAHEARLLSKVGEYNVLSTLHRSLSLCQGLAYTARLLLGIISYPREQGSETHARTQEEAD